ncbi:MAG: DNA mismatch repair endonuclease MutL, partial [Leptospiraceae bacterium]|nr:DNA mismatch repair endonuclease MutL [Leptospiraceae bacterium]
MGVIHSLPIDLINKIAAGEVIESAHSVVKELIENSSDAGSTSIQIHASKGGLEKIQVVDNGTGILQDDLPLTIQRHTTSKIQTLDDLETLSSFGFRGEALASIASVSKLRIQSGTSENLPASEIYVEMSQVVSQTQVSPRKGTFIEVSDLFYNTPVRRKFLKSERSEEGKIKDKVIQHALAHPKIQFTLSLNDKEIFSLKPSNYLQRILDIFGENLENFLMEVRLERRGIQAFGYISSPEFYKSNRTGQFTFINSRPVEIKYSSYM